MSIHSFFKNHDYIWLCPLNPFIIQERNQISNRFQMLEDAFDHGDFLEMPMKTLTKQNHTFPVIDLNCFKKYK